MSCYDGGRDRAAGHLLAGRDSPPPLVNPIGYWLDAGNDSAYWIAFSDDLDERQANLLKTPTPRPYTELLQAAPEYSILTSPAPLLGLESPHLEVLADDWVSGRRVMQARVTSAMRERIMVIIPKEAPLLAITLPDNDGVDLPPVSDRGWWLRFEGIPAKGIEMTLEFSRTGSIQFLLVEEKTGLPAFPGISTQPEPGTMKSPGVFTQAIPTDFTVINRNVLVPGIGP